MTIKDEKGLWNEWFLRKSRDGNHTIKLYFENNIHLRLRTYHYFRFLSKGAEKNSISCLIKNRKKDELILFYHFIQVVSMKCEKERKNDKENNVGQKVDL